MELLWVKPHTWDQSNNNLANSSIDFIQGWGGGGGLVAKLHISDETQVEQLQEPGGC